MQTVKKVTVAKFELAFTRYQHNLKNVGNLTVKTRCKTSMPKKCTCTLRIDQSRSKSVKKMFCLHHYRVFTLCCFKFMPVRVPFSKSTVFKIYRKIMCRFLVDGRPIRHIFTVFKMCLHRVNAVLLNIILSAK